METNLNELEQKLREADAGFDRIMSKLEDIQEKIDLLKKALTEENGN